MGNPRFPASWGQPPLLGGPAAMRDWIRSRIQLGRIEARSTGRWPAWLAPDGEGGRPDAALRTLQLHELAMLWEADEEPIVEARNAIAVHHTGVTGPDTPWFGSVEESHLKSGDVAAFKQAYAYQRDGADPRLKGSYGFPHHMISNVGVVGPASVRACESGVAILNGARGGSGISPDERVGVYDHLSAHLHDAGIEPAALRALALMYGETAARHLRQIARGW